jgi:hypothetical protein
MKRKMPINMACLFVATQYETKWRGEVVGWPCSILDLGEGVAEVIAPEDAFQEWDNRCKISSPSVNWP